jgi:hypothetical protein
MGIIILVVMFAFIAIVWDLSSISQFYAAAKQAQATIEVARVPQIFATGYLIAILIIVLLILAGLVTVIGTLWLLYRLGVKPTFKRAGTLRRRSTRLRQFYDQQITPPLSQQDSLNQLNQMMANQIYMQMQSDMHRQNQEQLNFPKDDNNRWPLPMQ